MSGGGRILGVASGRPAVGAECRALLRAEAHLEPAIAERAIVLAGAPAAAQPREG